MKPPNIYIVILIIFYAKYVTASSIGLNKILTRKILRINFMNDLQLNCTKGILKQEAPCGSFFTLIHRNNHGARLIQQLSINDCYHFIVRSPQSQKWILKSKAYIILFKNITDFVGVFHNLTKEYEWTPTAKFFLITKQLKTGEYLEVFSLLSKLNIFHVYLIYSVPTGEIYVSTYNPFLNNSCGNVSKEIIKINLCRGNEKFEIIRKEKENQLRNCPVTVLAIDYPPNVIFKSNQNVHYHGSSSTGIEQYMLDNIAQIENYKLQYIEQKRKNELEFIMDNCTSPSALGHLGDHPLGISIGAYILMKKRSECYDFIWGYCYANFNVYTLLAESETWRKVYQVFGTTTWELIAISYCTVVFSSYIIYNMLVGKMNKKFFAFKILGYLSNHSDQQLIKIRKLRIIMIIWLWFTFFILNFYNTTFYELLTAPNKKGLIVKPDKLFSSSLKPCISFKIRSWFKYTFNLTLSTQTWDECLHEESAIEAVLKDNQLYTLLSEPTFYKREYKYLDIQGHSKLDRWLFGTGDFAFTVIVNRGFPLVDKLQRYALYHFESGLLLKHTQDTYHQFMIITEFNSFQLQDFRIHFTILFVGYIISIIVYIVEINQPGK